MAAIFLAYSSKDLDLVRGLEDRLKAKGHTIRIPVDRALTGNWRLTLTKGLARADALVVLLTEKALGSRYVLGAVGAGRVLECTEGMLLLPVLPRSMTIPDFINDLFCFRLPTLNGAGLDTVVQQLDKAIADQVRMVPRIFISHRHSDEPIATALTALLEQAFHVAPSDIRCTSVQRYMLTPGERTSERLRADIAGAELVIGILSPDTSASNYVLCELGASWGRDVATFPVLVHGATPADVPPPLSERHSLSLEDAERCVQLMHYIANVTSLRPRKGTIDKVFERAQVLAKMARGSGPKVRERIGQRAVRTKQGKPLPLPEPRRRADRPR